MSRNVVSYAALVVLFIATTAIVLHFNILGSSSYSVVPETRGTRSCLYEERKKAHYVNYTTIEVVSASQITQHLPPDMEATVGKWLVSWQPEYARLTQKLSDEKVEPDDPYLISHVKNIIIPPSPHKVTKANLPIKATPQSKAAQKLLGNKKNGFFIECGALNGERASNTFQLENQMGWTGLLIEMDPYYFIQLLGHNRKSYSINACVSITRYSEMMNFAEAMLGTGKLSNKGALSVACYPLETMLAAIDVTKVDYFSLDVEGKELDVLKTIPFDKIDITVLSVETTHGPPRSEYDKYMASQGYVAHEHIKYNDVKIYLGVDDTIYVKKSFLDAKK